MPVIMFLCNQNEASYQKKEVYQIFSLICQKYMMILTLCLPGRVYSDNESRPPAAIPAFPSPSEAPVGKPPSASCAWVEPSDGYGSRGGMSLMGELKKAGDGAGRLGEYGGRRPTAVLGRLVGIAPWTGFWTRDRQRHTLLHVEGLNIEWNSYFNHSSDLLTPSV